MAINQTIQDFYQQASVRNFSRDFQLRITSFLVNGIDQIAEEDLVFLKSATLPGKTINVQSAPFMGLNFNIPGAVSYDSSNSWNVTFYCTQDFNLRKLLELSMGDTFDQESSTGNMEPRNLQQYKIVLSLLNDKLEPTRTYELLGCFVTNVGATTYNMTGNGAIQDVTATIAYQYWIADDTGGGTGVSRGIRRAGRDVRTIGGVVSQVGGTIGRVGSILSQIGNIFGGRR